jgi:hypothetical protein
MAEIAEAMSFCTSPDMELAADMSKAFEQA